MSHWNGKLINAAKDGNLADVQKELANCVDQICKDCALRTASKKGYIEIVKCLLSEGADVHYHNDFPLQIAADAGNLEIVKCLLAAGANVHADGELALQWAATEGHFEVVKYLLAAGANAKKFLDYEYRYNEKMVALIQDAVNGKLPSFLQEVTIDLKAANTSPETTNCAGCGGVLKDPGLGPIYKHCPVCEK